LKMALQKTLEKKHLKYRRPKKTYFCDKTIGSRELIFWTIPIKKCMNNLDFFQPNLRRSSGSHCPVWRGMTHFLKSTATLRVKRVPTQICLLLKNQRGNIYGRTT